MSAEKCPLPMDGAFLFEEDIPDECRDCLQITLDSDRGSYTSQTIGAAWEYNYKDGVISKCDHEMYYWQTGVNRETDSVRNVHVMAECDECSNFVLSALLTKCKTND